jgi:hypothetical protein
LKFAKLTASAFSSQERHMTRVIISEDCGNSPKNTFVEKLVIAIAKGDSKFMFASVTDDIRWNFVGGRQIGGKADFIKAFEQMKNNKVLELSIDHIATHGKAGAVDGKIKMESGKTFGFCDVFEFNGAKATSICAITSYVIEIR